ncbi:MAG: efflux RND transporter periplasmic adaptor subunit [Planctomycetota bacterium]
MTSGVGSGTGGGSYSRTVIASVFGVVRFVLVVGLIGLGVGAAYWFNNAPQAPQETGQGEDAGAREEVARAVVVEVASVGDHPVVVGSMGTVIPSREAVIRPRVGGAIVEASDRFVPGGFLDAGAFMVQIDRADYEQAVEQRRSDLARAEAALQIELGDQAVAKEELELLEIDIPEINRDLILRIPQVNRAEAEVRSAEAALERATLDLERTRITAPFAGHLVEREVNLGANVSPGDDLATLVGAEAYWVELTLPVSSLRWIETADERAGPADGSEAVVSDARAWGAGVVRSGVVARRIGRLEQGSRLARVLVRVPDPLAREPERAGLPELILGAFVNVELRGRVLESVCVLDRSLVREGDRVWVMDGDDRLAIRPVEIAYRGPDRVYVTAGLASGDRVVRTNLVTPVEGMLLRVADEAPGARDAGDGGDGDD